MKIDQNKLNQSRNGEITPCKKSICQNNGKAVREIKVDGTEVLYKSLSEAAKATGFHASTILRHCHLPLNKKTISTGSSFCFVNDWNKEKREIILKPVEKKADVPDGIMYGKIFMDETRGPLINVTLTIYKNGEIDFGKQKYSIEEIGLIVKAMKGFIADISQERDENPIAQI